MGAIERRDEYAAKILAGFAANPAIFAPNPQCGWSLVNCTDAEIAAYAVRLATHLFHATDAIGLEQTSSPSGTAPAQVSGTAEAGHSSQETSDARLMSQPDATGYVTFKTRKARCPHGVSELNHCNTCD